jgi:nucleoside-diphosphate-sugar epimerase
MVVGNGLIAKKFKDYAELEDVVIFASGVSNSKDVPAEEYIREIKLLQSTMDIYPNSLLVYFSTCSIFDPEENQSAYIIHKKNIESLITKKQKHYNIFRISNLAGHTNNQFTILNFLIHNITNHIHFNIWQNAVRNIIDVNDMYKIVHFIISNKLLPNSIINIANPFNYLVTDIAATIENIFNTKGNYSKIVKGTAFTIDVGPIKDILTQTAINFKGDYLKNTILKYYSKK